MRTSSFVKSFATHTATLFALTLPAACATDVGDPQTTPGKTDTAGLSAPPEDVEVAPFSLTPEGASPADGYWVSTVSFDNAGNPVLVDAYPISETEMLEHSAKQQAALLAQGKEAAPLDTEGSGAGPIQARAATVVDCSSSAASTALGLYQFQNLTGNRICIVGGGNLDWFRLYNWYWFLNQPNQTQISGNIGSYIHFKRFFIEAWVDNRIDTHPLFLGGAAFDWPRQEICFSAVPTNCGNPNGCVSGSVSNSDTRNQCGQYITWLHM